LTAAEVVVFFLNFFFSDTVFDSINRS